MERFTEVEKILRKQKVSGFIPSQNITHIAGKDYANVLFHSYTHADKSIQILKDNGFTVLSGRERNLTNAYFKYFVTITLSNN